MCSSGSYIYHHTFRMFDKQGHGPEPYVATQPDLITTNAWVYFRVNLQVSFGKGENVRTICSLPSQCVAYCVILVLDQCISYTSSRAARQGDQTIQMGHQVHALVRAAIYAHTNQNHVEDVLLLGRVRSFSLMGKK